MSVSNFGCFVEALSPDMSCMFCGGFVISEPDTRFNMSSLNSGEVLHS